MCFNSVKLCCKSVEMCFSSILNVFHQCCNLLQQCKMCYKSSKIYLKSVEMCCCSVEMRLKKFYLECRALPMLPLDWPPKKTLPKTPIFQLWYQVQVVQDHPGSPHDHLSSTIFFKKNF